MKTALLAITFFAFSGAAFAWNTPCADDCSGHEAGYQWAEDNDIDNPDDCGGNSSSFIDGCQEYAEDNSDEEDYEDEDEEE